MQLWMAAAINADGTVAGKSAGLSSVTKGAAGIYDLNLAAGYAIDAAECAVTATPREAIATNGSFAAVSHTSDTVKRVTTSREGGAGAGALADIAFNVIIVRLPAMQAGEVA